MGEMARRIVKTDLNELIRVLNEAYAEEWLAYYQYWIAARLAEGRMRGPIVDEFKKHAHEEKEHAKDLAERILQLGGVPIVSPDEWNRVAKCHYEVPVDDDTQALVKQVLSSERCAIGRYQGLCDMCFGKDYETFRLSQHILRQEIDHEQDMEDFLTDMAPKNPQTR
jgi:bacterioferritin